MPIARVKRQTAPPVAPFNAPWFTVASEKVYKRAVCKERIDTKASAKPIYFVDFTVSVSFLVLTRLIIAVIIL